MDGGAWKAAVHGVAEGQTQLSAFTLTFHFPALEKEMAPTPVFLPGESQGWRSLVGYSPWGRKDSDMTEQLYLLHFICLTLEYIREKAMAPHSSTRAWKIPWMEEPGGLQSVGSLRVRHD